MHDPCQPDAAGKGALRRGFEGGAGGREHRLPGNSCRSTRQAAHVGWAEATGF
jgi:hypothetical protein